LTALTPSVFVILRSAVETASVSLAVLFAGVGSDVPNGGSTCAVFVNVPFVAVTVAVKVNVTLPPAGSTGITMPVPWMSPTFVVPQAAPPCGLPQETLVAESPAETGSVTKAPSAADGPALLTTIVYVVVLPEIAVVIESVLVMETSAKSTLSTSVAVLLVESGSPTPLGGTIDAVLVIAPPGAVTLAATVNVRLAPLGNVPMTIPGPCIKGTLVVGQTAPSVSLPHVTAVMLMPAAIGSEKIAPSAADPPRLLTTIEYTVVPPTGTLSL
jgi:hypothetical protein